jgi:hypothetical protein
LQSSSLSYLSQVRQRKPVLNVSAVRSASILQVLNEATNLESLCIYISNGELWHWLAFLAFQAVFSWTACHVLVS